MLHDRASSLELESDVQITCEETPNTPKYVTLHVCPNSFSYHKSCTRSTDQAFAGWQPGCFTIKRIRFLRIYLLNIHLSILIFFHLAFSKVSHDPLILGCWRNYLSSMTSSYEQICRCVRTVTLKYIRPGEWKVESSYHTGIHKVD